MVFLGFSAGLPFLLVFSTLSAWFADVGIDKKTIGFFSWVGITYSIKVLWAPVIDHTPIPWLTAVLGKRRSWMLVAQFMIATGLVAMAFSDPYTDLRLIAFFALLVAFGSATQDVAIDAYRIEAVDNRWQGAMAANYVFGYRVALLVAGAGAFYLAEWQSWSFAYMAMALFMLVGVLTTLIVDEPHHMIADTFRSDKYGRRRDWFFEAVITPFVEFFHRNGRMAVVILLLIGTYKISDITMGVMANPFYLELGFSKIEIANIAKLFGFFMTLLGAFLGGVFVVKYGVEKPLILGAAMIILTNLLFVGLAMVGDNLSMLALVISADNLSGGFATSAFIAYLSGLTNRNYSATQYALFSSFMTLPAKVIGGFSGIVVDSAGFAWFFLYAGLLGVPALLLVIYVVKRTQAYSI